MKGGACQGMPVELFYADDPDPVVLEACRGCRCRNECAAEGLATPKDQDFGVRGGWTAPQRRAVRDRRREPARVALLIAATCPTCDRPVEVTETEVIDGTQGDALLVCTAGHRSYLSIELHEKEGCK